MKNQSWYEEGCYYNAVQSSDEQSVCDCYHLTNFAIIMDYSGQVDPDNPFLSWFTIINLSLSIGFIMLTEIIVFYQQKRTRGYQMRTMVKKRQTEMQRNLCLVCGQLGKDPKNLKEKTVLEFSLKGMGGKWSKNS